MSGTSYIGAEIYILKLHVYVQHKFMVFNLELHGNYLSVATI